MSARFTIDGSAELERKIAQLCETVRAGVESIVPASRLEGLVLAGGYGRGEGGVLRENGTDLPYNDLEFFVFIRGSTFFNDRRYQQALHEFGESLSPGAGLDVEFKVLSLAKLRSGVTSMFYYDLLMGHRWIIGDDSLFAGCEHHRNADVIPAHEATRLLFNRCSGLLFARERLSRADFTAADADFVGRNLAKAQLALGDALLAADGRYHWSCLERQLRLRAGAALERHHSEGVAFKLHPRRSTLTRAELAALHAELVILANEVFLKIEGARLGRKFATATDYATSGVNKCPEHPAWKNLLVHLRSRGIPQRKMRYPRELLLHELALMLWGDKPVTSASVGQYATLWSRFN